MNLFTNLRYKYFPPSERSPVPLSPALFSILPDLFMNEPLSVRANLIQTHSAFRRHPDFFLKVKKEELMYRVQWGNQAKAEALLQKAEHDPVKLSALLCEKVTNQVLTLFGKPVKHQLTAFQAAFCALDVAEKPGQIRMVEMFQRYFEKLPNGREEMQNQINEVLAMVEKQIEASFPEGIGFPEGDEPRFIRFQQYQAQRFKTEILDPLIAAINAATPEEVNIMLEEKHSPSPLGKAFDTFRKKMEEISGNDIISNHFYLLEAFNLYERPQVRDWLFNSEDKNKERLFRNQGLGFIQRCLPAGTLQWLARDYGKRSFKFQYNWEDIDVLVVYPLAVRQGLGFKYWVVALAAMGGGGWYMKPVAARRAGRLFRDFCQTKTAGLASLCDGVRSNHTRAIP